MFICFLFPFYIPSFISSASPSMGVFISSDTNVVPCPDFNKKEMLGVLFDLSDTSARGQNIVVFKSMKYMLLVNVFLAIKKIVFFLSP